MKAAKVLAKTSAGIAFLFGVCVVVGWMFGMRSLVTVLPGLPAMSLNTALGLILASASLGLLQPQSLPTLGPKSLRPSAQRFLAVLVGLVGLLTIAEYVFRVDLCINRLLLPSTLTRVEANWASRPSPQTATSLLFMGLSLLLIGLPAVRKRLPQLFAIVPFAISLVALLGYAYGVPAFYSISASIGMALHTSVAVALLALGILCIHPDTGVMRIFFSRTSGGNLARWLLPLVVIIPAVLGWLRLQGERSGFYGAEVGVAVMVVATSLALIVFTWLAAESLSRADDQFRAVAETANDAVVSANARGKIVYFNQAAERMFGYSAKEALKQPLTRLMPARFHSAHKQGFERFVATGEGRVIGKTVELAGRRKDASEFPLELSLSSWHSQDEVHFTGIIRDISDRRRAEAELLLRTRELEAAKSELRMRQLEERFAKAFQSSPVALTISTQMDGVYVDVNDAFLRLMGYSWAEVVGRTASDLNVWAFPEQRIAMLGELDRSGRVSLFEAEFRTKSGEACIVQVSAELITLESTTCVLQTALDVTESKRLEGQLRQAQKMEAIGRLAGGIAHDFNNILGVVIGHSDLAIRHTTNDESVRKHLEQIMHAGQRAAALTRQLLAFSRQQILQPRVLNLNTVVNNLNKMIVRIIGEDVSLSFAPAAVLGNVQVDLGQIEQILLNLAVNARDAMPTGGKILLETANVELDQTYTKQHPNVEPGRYVMLAVSDTGCGMNAKTLSLIFEPFFTTKPVGEGTGLGLSIVYGIVKQSGGHIWVYSELGKGTTFKIYFPRVDEAVEIPVEPKVQMLAKGWETILVVEDDEALRELTVSLLESGGYKVLTAGNASAAITLSAQHNGPIHLLLTDIIMPGENGHKLASSLKESRSDLKVMYMSGYTGNLIAHHGVLGPESHLIQKPFTQQSLLVQVRIVLDSGERNDGATTTLLLVEDKLELRDLAREILERAGYTVLEATSGERAMEVAETCKRPIRLLVTDVSLPGMSGPMLAKRLSSQTPELKVLYVSGHSPDIDSGRYIVRSGGAFLQKPYSPEQLLHKVRELLKPSAGTNSRIA